MKPTDKYLNWKKREIRTQARHLVVNCSNSAAHNIGNRYFIFHFGVWEVVDCSKMSIVCFESEQEALDFCLDRYSLVKGVEQLTLTTCNECGGLAVIQGVDGVFRVCEKCNVQNI